ncbi:hypothetical protein BDA96_01G194400 [Sorghum bicolor]|uniref:Uncharacterized protein n=1 Tax=Sorghum bicolor TaxID=4558 RepID=A0A921S1D3_SORBI|nr:hypothetical protein BDA96_01G194400 [Sorghum bicolor]
MSKSPRELQELITAVDAAGHGVHVNVDSASSWDSSKHLGHRRRSTYNNGRAVVEASTEASFEFSAAVVSYSSASPASMVFSDGQLRAHQFPAVRSSSASAGSRHLAAATSPVRSSSTGSYSTKQQAGPGVTGSTKRVSFATDGPNKAGGGQGKKMSGGLLGCMGSPCGPSSRNEAVVEPVARNDNRKVVAF